MEKKTIGGFIAALRKANGMTQKDLAERLNVSDKTVSRWERDDGAPDLSLIPVIAEIFGVSCDELLRGGRRPPEERSEPESGDPGPRGERQLRLLLRSTLSRYQSRTYIAMGVSALGLISALICDLAFLSAVLGFLLGAVFFAASLVCQAVFVNRAFFAVEDSGLDPLTLSGFKRRVIALAEGSVGLTLILTGFTLPLVMVDAYMGLTAESLLLWGAVGAAAMGLVYCVAVYFLNAALLKRGTCVLSEKEAAVYRRNHRLKGKCALTLAALFVVTFIAHQAATTIWGPRSIMKGVTFNDYESFTAFMEQDVPAQYYGDAAPAADEWVGAPTYYDEYGREISEEEALKSSLLDNDGNVVCEYIRRNNSVIAIRYSPGDGTILPITVCTQADLQSARETAAVRHALFAAAYCVEALAVLLFYFMRRAR